MVNMNYKILDEFISRGVRAKEYALDNFDVLHQRVAAHTLYGPPTPYLGVLAAGHLSPAKKRKLQKRTRGKKYIQYELDQNFRVIRVKHINNYNHLDCTYHMFELDGVSYGQPFLGNQKILYPGVTIEVKNENDKPVYFAMTRKNYVCVDYYSFPQPDLVMTQCFLYSPEGKYASTGLLKNWNAELGAQDSPVTIDYFQEEYHHIDFSTFIKTNG